MSVDKYSAHGKWYWRVDCWLKLPSGMRKRFREGRIATKEAALMLERKVLADAFEARWYPGQKMKPLSVKEAWEDYAPISRRDNDSWRSDRTRSATIIRHLGHLNVLGLSLKHVDDYRTARFAEKTKRKKPPTPGTLDREIELLKRFVNYAFKTKRIESNPLAGIKLLNKPNVRTMVVDEHSFAVLHVQAPEFLKPMLLLGFDTGMRLSEILNLSWKQVSLREGVIRIAPQEDKEEGPCVPA